MLTAQSKWVWTPKQDTANANYSDCYFRKKFSLVKPKKSELFIAAGDKYELYINGQMVSKRDSYGSPQKLDVTEFLLPGVNLVAVKVSHFEGQSVGLAMRLRVLERGEKAWRHLQTDKTWKTRQQPQQQWYSTSFRDLGWLPAKELQLASAISPASNGATQGSSNTSNSKSTAATPVSAQKPLEASTTTNKSKLPPIRKVQRVASGTEAPKSAPGEAGKGVATTNTAPPSVASSRKSINSKPKYTLPPKFTVEKVVSQKEAGSIIAMAFNEFGKLLVSEEGGPLKVIDLNQRPGKPERVKVLCDKVNTCQGILPLNGSVFVTGMGPEGLGLYKLLDRDRDESYETIELVVSFAGQIGEHGPHGLVLGNDGMIYVSIGNASGLTKKADDNSPFKHPYDADLVPRFEDPGGHAVGVKAPGGTIIRVSVDGSKIQTVAGGIRNAYDLVFDANGDLFVHDSDMESDMGMSWYRPTTIFHVFDGADMGWRSGWAKYPEYYLDQAPATARTGRGSPSGAVLYQHLAFPAKYHDALFFADWSEGRIMFMRPQPKGAGSQGKAEVFLAGKALNVVDLDVGEDGGLYFCTGGRGTAGGVFRVKWGGQIPKAVLTFENDLARVIRHPQPNAAWARQNIAKLRQKLGKEWGPAMKGIALEKGNTSKFRVRALENMVLYGPNPDSEFLKSLIEDKDLLVRSRVADICGLKKTSGNVEILKTLLKDKEPRVRRCACESLLKLGVRASLDDLSMMLDSLDRVENSVARRMLERTNPEIWRDAVLQSKNIRTFIQGGMSLMVAYPNLENAYQVLARASEYMDGYVNDRDFIDLLRVVEMSLAQGHVSPENVPAFVLRMKNEFPSQSSTINNELSRILAYLKGTGFDGRLVEYLSVSSSSTEIRDRVHVAMQLQSIGAGLDSNERLALIDLLEKARTQDGGGSYRLYIEKALGNLVQTMPMDQIGAVIKNAPKWPIATVASFRILPRLLDSKTIDLLVQADRDVASFEQTEFKQIRLGVIAVFGSKWCTGRHGISERVVA